MSNIQEHNPFDAPQSSLKASENTYQPKIFSATGRLGRLRFLAYNTGVNFVLSLLLIPFSLPAEGSEEPSTLMLGILGIFYIAMFIAYILFGKRRLNDTGHTGWWLLLSAIPFVNIIFGLYLIFAPGSNGENAWGLQPSPNPTIVVILGLMLPILFFVGMLAAIAIPAYNQYMLSAGL